VGAAIVLPRVVEQVVSVIGWTDQTLAETFWLPERELLSTSWFDYVSDVELR
jgi:hypothetical protein